MPRISIGRFCYNSAPFRARGLDADSTRQGKRAVRGGHAPLQAHRGEDRPAYRAARPRVLRKADRNDLAAAEKFEIEVLSAYLPRQMSDAEIGEAVAAAVAESGASGMKDMGKVMAALKARLAGRADMGKVSNLVKTRLSG